MHLFNKAFGKIFEILFYPFDSMSLWLGMIFISILTGLLMLLIFRYSSNQEGIRKVKNKIKAHLLELRLYKDSLSLSLRSQGNILRSNLRYMGYSAKPMLIMIIPLILIIIQLNFWFAYDSLLPGQKTLLKVKLDKKYKPLDLNIVLKPSPGVNIDSPPLRMESDNEINWRLSIEKKGIHNITLSVNNHSFTKKIIAAQKQLTRISPKSVQNNFFEELMNPGESPFPKGSSVKAIEISYPKRNMNFFGWHLHWIIVYFGLSIIFGFALKGLFKVEI